MSVTIRAKLPAGDRDGLQAHSDDLRTLREPIVVVAALYPKHVIEQLDDEAEPFRVVCGIAQIEALDGLDASAARALLESEYERRTGKQPLPFGTILDDSDGGEP